MNEGLNLALVFGAGLTSVLSPCVLPLLPIVVVGPQGERRSRPLLVVAGLSTTFVLMGILTTLFAAVIGPAMGIVEKAAAVVIILFGLLIFFDVNLFKKLGFFSALGGSQRGGWGGYLLGATLGLIWIPCIGPILSGVLAMVASKASLGSGIGYLLVYSAGFSLPLFVAGYASRFFRQNLGFLRTHPLLYRLGGGGVLVALGVYILSKGMVGFGVF
jgi:cytochrome c-type biogenesis protein